VQNATVLVAVIANISVLNALCNQNFRYSEPRTRLVFIA